MKAYLKYCRENWGYVALTALLFIVAVLNINKAPFDFWNLVLAQVVLQITSLRHVYLHREYYEKE